MFNSSVCRGVAGTRPGVSAVAQYSHSWFVEANVAIGRRKRLIRAGTVSHQQETAISTASDEQFCGKIALVIPQLRQIITDTYPLFRSLWFLRYAIGDNKYCFRCKFLHWLFGREFSVVCMGESWKAFWWAFREARQSRSGVSGCIFDSSQLVSFILIAFLICDNRITTVLINSTCILCLITSTKKLRNLISFKLDLIKLWGILKK